MSTERSEPPGTRYVLVVPSVTMTLLCETHPARLTSHTTAAVEATDDGIPADGTDKEFFSVPTIDEQEGAKISENQEIEDLEKRDFDDVEGISSDEE